MKKKKLVILITILSGTLGFSTPVMAKDVEKMTFDELKIAYLELQLDYEKLKLSIDEVKEISDGTDEDFTEDMDSDGEKTLNADNGYKEVQEVQRLLNQLGYYGGIIDGTLNEYTYDAIMTFQQMYGYEPDDGIIDKELTEQLKKALERDAYYKTNCLSGKYNAEIIIKNYGKIKLVLDADIAPITVTNFVNLVQDGFYNGLTIHRVVDDFVIQGGDPNGDGTGDADEKIKGEFSNNGIENNISHTRGTVSMARRMGCNTASSQFFICQADNDFLDEDYAAFGHVTEGMDIVDKICKEIIPENDMTGYVAEEQPIIESIKIVD